MRLRPWVVLVLAGLGGCAEGQVDDDGGGLGDAIVDKDTKFIEELPKEEDVGEPPVDAGEADAGGGVDAQAMDASTPDDGGSTVDAGGMDAAVEDTGPVDTGVIDTGPPDTGVIDTGPPDTGPIDTGVRDTGPVDTGVRDTGPVDTGTTDTGPMYPPILCPLLGTPIPITCRSRNGLPPCCGIGGACFCEQRTPLGNFCLPCS